MTPRVSVSLGGLRSPVPASRIAHAVARVLRAERARAALISVSLVSPRTIAALNQRHLGHRGATDVIAFGFRDPEGAAIGDVYICPSVARENARAFGVRVCEELLRLVVHGTLHVLGHDHPAGEARMRSPMWRRQERHLARILRA